MHQEPDVELQYIYHAQAVVHSGLELRFRKNRIIMSPNSARALEFEMKSSRPMKGIYALSAKINDDAWRLLGNGAILHSKGSKFAIWTRSMRRNGKNMEEVDG